MKTTLTLYALVIVLGGTVAVDLGYGANPLPQPRFQDDDQQKQHYKTKPRQDKTARFGVDDPRQPIDVEYSTHQRAEDRHRLQEILSEFEIDNAAPPYSVFQVQLDRAAVRADVDWDAEGLHHVIKHESTLVGFVSADEWEGFQARYPAAKRLVVDEKPVVESDRVSVEPVGSYETTQPERSETCVYLQYDGDEYEEADGDVTESPTWAHGVLLSEGQLDWAWVKYRFYLLPTSADPYTYLELGAYFKDTSWVGNGPTLYIYNWQTATWDMQWENMGKDEDWYIFILGDLTIGKYISSNYRNLLVIYEASPIDCTDLREVDCYYCYEECQNVSANFSGSPRSGNPPLSVNFTDQSSGGTISQWSWDFADGGTSTQRNPSHTYSSAGTYTVRLTATNSCGNSDTETKTNYITVCSNVTANFTGSPRSGSPPLSVNFTDQSSGGTISQWSWDFGRRGDEHPTQPIAYVQ